MGIWFDLIGFEKCTRWRNFFFNFIVEWQVLCCGFSLKLENFAINLRANFFLDSKFKFNRDNEFGVNLKPFQSLAKASFPQSLQENPQNYNFNH